MDLVPFLMLAFFALFLWQFAYALAYFVAGRNRESLVLSDSVSRDDWLTVALFVLGVYLLVSGVPRLAASGALWIYHLIQGGSVATSQPFYFVSAIREVLELAAGLWLVMKSRHIAAGLFKSPSQAVREVGRDSEHVDAA